MIKLVLKNTVSIEITPESRIIVYGVPLWIRLFHILSNNPDLHIVIYIPEGELIQPSKQEIAYLEGKIKPNQQNQSHQPSEPIPQVHQPHDMNIPGHFYPFHPDIFGQRVFDLLSKMRDAHISDSLIQSFLGHQGHFFVDSVSIKQIKRALLNQLRQPEDTLVSRTINRPISLQITGYISRFPMSPDAVTTVVFLIGLAAVFFIASPELGYLGALFGGILLHISSILDGCDGELARLTYQTSDFGKYYDDISDEVVHVLLLFALAIRIHPDAYLSWAILGGSLLIAAKAAQYGLLHLKKKKGIRNMRFFFDDTKHSAPQQHSNHETPSSGNSTSHENLNLSKNQEVWKKILYYMSQVARRDMLAVFIMLTMIFGLYMPAFFVFFVFIIGVFAFSVFELVLYGIRKKE